MKQVNKTTAAIVAGSAGWALLLAALTLVK